MSLAPRATMPNGLTSEKIKRDWSRAYWCNSRSVYLSGFVLSSRLSTLLAVAFCRDVFQLLGHYDRKFLEEIEARLHSGLPFPDRQYWRLRHGNSSIPYYHFFSDNPYGMSLWIEVSFSPGNIQNCCEHQGKLLVSVIGPGWVFDPAWRTSTAVQLGNVIYDGREWGLMPILADAIQDAGCEENVLLEELRSPESMWCRGCRILDALLEKE